MSLASLLAGGAHEPIVYFVHLSGAVKIGWTTNLRRRMEKLTLDLSWVVRIIPGDNVLEAAFHREFARQRLLDRREWFACEGELRRFLAPVLPEAATVPPMERQVAAERRSRRWGGQVVAEAPRRPEGGFTLAEIAQMLQAEGIDVKATLLSTHKHRRPDFPKPIDPGDMEWGRDYYAYEPVRAYYVPGGGTADPSSEGGDTVQRRLNA